MQQRVLLYLHGLGSSGRSDTGMFLRQHYAENIILSCPDYRPQFFHESVDFIDAHLDELRAPGRAIAVLGSSMGGWHALHALSRHADITVLALNPVLNPGALRRDSPPDDVDQTSGTPLPWPDLSEGNFPAAPATMLDRSRLRLLIGEQDDVVPPQPTLEACASHHWSHRTFAEWGHRAELGTAMREEVDALIQRAASRIAAV